MPRGLYGSGHILNVNVATATPVSATDIRQQQMLFCLYGHTNYHCYQYLSIRFYYFLQTTDLQWLYFLLNIIYLVKPLDHRQTNRLTEGNWVA
jgi:hypothetical protein